MFNSHSINECNCIPWDLPRNNTHQLKTICKDDGKDCFQRKMANVTKMEENQCFCLSDCSIAKYPYSEVPLPLEDHCIIGKYFDEQKGYLDQVGYFMTKEVDWYKKLSKDVLEANPSTLAFLRVPLDKSMIWKDWESLNRTVTDIYYTELCKQIQNEDKIRITIRLEGSTFMELKRFLRVSFTDQLGSIGGTLGLFSGFSLLAIVELIHWVCMIVCSIVTRRHEQGAFSD